MERGFRVSPCRDCGTIRWLIDDEQLGRVDLPNPLFFVMVPRSFGLLRVGDGIDLPLLADARAR